MTELRVMKNTSRVASKKWKLVEGYYKYCTMSKWENTTKWKTTFEISHHDSKQEAVDAMEALNKQRARVEERRQAGLRS